MTFDQSLFATVTLTALFLYIISGNLAIIFQYSWKGDTLLDQWWDPAAALRFFTVQRSQVKSRISWFFIIAHRAAFCIFAVSGILDILIN